MIGERCTTIINLHLTINLKNKNMTVYIEMKDGWRERNVKRLFKIVLIMILFVHLTGPITIHAETEEEMTPIKEEIFYHILVDRFNNGNQSLNEEVDIDDELAYHGGDLKGITKKLDSLSELGFTTIVLSPVMKNAKKGYHGYWIEDFFDVEPQFGTLDDLNELIKE